MQNQKKQNDNSEQYLQSSDSKGSHLLAARAFCVFGIAHRPLDLGSVIPLPKTLVMPETVVPLFEAPNGKAYENYHRPADPLSDFDILFVKSFLEANPINLSAHAKNLGIGPTDVARIIRGLKP